MRLAFSVLRLLLAPGVSVLARRRWFLQTDERFSRQSATTRDELESYCAVVLIDAAPPQRGTKPALTTSVGQARFI